MMMIIVVTMMSIIKVRMRDEDTKRRMSPLGNSWDIRYAHTSQTSQNLLPPPLEEEE